MRQRDVDDPEKGFGKIISEDWKNLDEKRRGKYMEMALEEEKAYMGQLNQYKQHILKFYS